MKAYGKRQMMRAARAGALDEIAACAEHFDLITLMTLHRQFGFGAKRLTKFYREFTAMYEYYKHRYLTLEDSTVCGDRTDTYALKKRLKEIGFDYDAMCKTILAEDAKEKNGGGNNGNTE